MDCEAYSPNPLSLSEVSMILIHKHKIINKLHIIVKCWLPEE